MNPPRLVDCPSFIITGKGTWISEPDNSQFARFWEQSREAGWLDKLTKMRGSNPGLQTGGMILGVSRVENDPSIRSFNYMIAIEQPEEQRAVDREFESYAIPACRWAVFECWGPVPDSIVEAEMYAFMKWLPSSDYAHALAPEMEVYLPDQAGAPGCEFWLPVLSSRSRKP
jgi:AraC family transcriptional regulator